MAAATHNLVIRRGATWSQVFTWKDPSGTPINLTGYTAKMQIRPKPGGQLITELTTENGRIALGGVAGTVTLQLSDEETRGLFTKPGVYQYDLELMAAGTVVPFVSGAVEVQARVNYP